MFINYKKMNFFRHISFSNHENDTLLRSEISVPSVAVTADLQGHAVFDHLVVAASDSESQSVSAHAHSSTFDSAALVAEEAKSPPSLKIEDGLSALAGLLFLAAFHGSVFVLKHTAVLSLSLLSYVDKDIKEQYTS